MELKQDTSVVGSRQSPCLLIVPYGIETGKNAAGYSAGSVLLIVPYGIETGDIRRDTAWKMLLIVPYGIETGQIVF